MKQRIFYSLALHKSGRYIVRAFRGEYARRAFSSPDETLLGPIPASEHRVVISTLNALFVSPALNYADRGRIRQKRSAYLASNDPAVRAAAEASAEPPADPPKSKPRGKRRRRTERERVQALARRVAALEKRLRKTLESA